VFQSFTDSHLLTLPSFAEAVSNLKALLALLGECYVAMYSSSG